MNCPKCGQAHEPGAVFCGKLWAGLRTAATRFLRIVLKHQLPQQSPSNKLTNPPLLYRLFKLRPLPLQTQSYHRSPKS